MNLGAPEILVILVVALVVFGPHRLPEIGRQVGGAMRELRKMQDSVKSELQSVMNESEPTYDKPKTTEITASALDEPQLADEPDHSDPPHEPTDSSPGFDGPSGSFR